jgi:glycosyltransferase involved in cell wall biosynthesis
MEADALPTPPPREPLRLTSQLQRAAPAGSAESWSDRLLDSAASMRILAITQKLPSPVHDGYNLRMAAYLPRLAARHEVALASLERGALDPALEQSLSAVLRIPEREAPRASLFSHALGVLSPDELYDRDPHVDVELARFCAQFRPDVIWSVGWRMLPHALALRGVPIVADAVDEAVREAWIDLRRRTTPRRLVHFARVLRFERRYFPRAQRVLFVSDQDARVTSKVVPRSSCAVTPNGVDIEHYRPVPGPEDPDLLVFEGALVHPPNVQAVRFFVAEVLPRIRAVRPAARFLVVGRDPPPELLELSKPDPRTSGVEFTGFVDDVRPYVRRASVFVSPLIGGAGLKNKVLQAWALGKPVIATPMSVGGLDAKDGEELIVAGTPEAFASACLRALGDADLRAKLGAAGRRAAVERCSWESATARLEAELERVGARKR